MDDLDFRNEIRVTLLPCRVNEQTPRLTSPTWFGALGPALQRPLVGVEFSQKNIVVGDEWQQVFMYNILVCQADLGVLFLGNDLPGNTERLREEENTTRDAAIKLHSPTLQCLRAGGRWF